ncbi:mitochondrial carrier family [Plasmopara halstedii]|uniref:Mitochondrial carrier family n=1 Tax=Plasmopara halstedii TaxID=4781 RepID=A0A0P1B315_PLAHL|nr:mitochondrial carrier family [Plasmopara halstedii]CEG48030.1 mitochondrial carrier family [Plasmopara halstedii]|eukprot:XP_024584399.1 mitochondrial carrier family [Plasmopara halstedii]
MGNSGHSQTNTGLESVIAGVVAGCVTRSCTSPLDVLKIVIQVNGPLSPKSVTATSSITTDASVSTPSAFVARRTVAVRSSASSAIARTVRELYALDGVRAFWRGNSAGCCRLGPYAGLKFYLFDTLQAHFVARECRDLSNWQSALCGAAAGLLATMGTYPLEVVRTRMILQTANPAVANSEIYGVLQGVRLIFEREGLRGLYRGGWSGVAGAIPFEGVQFGCYEYLKRKAIHHQWPAYRWPKGKTEMNGMDYFVCGSVAGAIAQTVAYPFDTVKKRLQSQQVNLNVSSMGPLCAEGGNPSTLYYRGMVDCFRKVIRDEGPLALYRGTGPNLARIVPYAAVMFSTYETTKKALRVLSSRD